MVSSPTHPPTLHREIVEPIDQIDHAHLVAPIYVLENIAVGQKRPAWAHQTL
jgi:hypothetical protein